jgi:hypothetical protein
MRATLPSKPPKLSVWRTVLDAYRLTLANLGALGTLAWSWLLVLLVVSAGLYWTFWPSEMAARETGSGGSSALFLATYMTSSIAGAAVAVGWHRFLLLGEDPLSRPSLALDGRVVRYFATLLALVVIFFLPVLLIDILTPWIEETRDGELDASAVATIVYSVAAIILIPFVNRMMLILPAIAVEAAPPSLGSAWRYTRRNTWRLLFGTVLTLLPIIAIAVPLVMVDAVAGAAESRSAFTLRNTLNDVAAFLIGMVGVTFLTVAYRELWPPPAGVSAPPVSR